MPKYTAGVSYIGRLPKDQLDSDGDGIIDAMNLCPTPAGESTNLEGCSQSELTMPTAWLTATMRVPEPQGSVVDANRCSESDVVDNDADGDGVVDTYDTCRHHRWFNGGPKRLFRRSIGHRR